MGDVRVIVVVVDDVRVLDAASENEKRSANKNKTPPMENTLVQFP